MLRRLALAALSAAYAAPALADDVRPAAALPGVQGGHSIVAPMPEPPDAAPASGTKQVGKWELTVSGYVWVQVGTSSAADGR